MNDWTQTAAWLYAWAGERLPQVLDLTVKLFLILLLAWALQEAARRSIRLIHETLRRRTDCGEDIKRIDTLVRVARYAASVVILVLAGGIALSTLGISVAPLLATAGVAGIAIGFGAQSLVKDLFSGLFVLLENQIRVGDIVDIAGHSGVVEEVTLRYVRLRDYEGNVHFVPNGEITTVTSRSREFANAVIDVRMAPTDRVADIYAIMFDVAKAMREDEYFGGRMLGDLEMAGVDQWQESALIVRARIRVAAMAQWEVRREFLRRVKEAYDERGQTMPLPHLTLRFADDAEATLREVSRKGSAPRRTAPA